MKSDKFEIVKPNLHVSVPLRPGVPTPTTGPVSFDDLAAREMTGYLSPETTEWVRQAAEAQRRLYYPLRDHPNIMVPLKIQVPGRELPGLGAGLPPFWREPKRRGRKPGSGTLEAQRRDLIPEVLQLEATGMSQNAACWQLQGDNRIPPFAAGVPKSNVRQLNAIVTRFKRNLAASAPAVAARKRIWVRAD